MPYWCKEDRIERLTQEEMKLEFKDLKARFIKFNEDWRQSPTRQRSEDVIRANQALNEAEKYLKQDKRYGTGYSLYKTHITWLREDLERFGY